jgi:hypothetical protein
MNEILDEEIQEEKPAYRIRYGTCVFWLSIFFIGYLFRIMHWPGHSICTLIGASGFIAYNLFFAIKFRGKNITNTIFMLMSFIWIVYILSGCFLNNGYPFNLYGLIIHSGAIIVFYILYSIFKKPIKKQ